MFQRLYTITEKSIIIVITLMSSHRKDIYIYISYTLEDAQTTQYLNISVVPILVLTLRTKSKNQMTKQ